MQDKAFLIIDTHGSRSEGRCIIGLCTPATVELELSFNGDLFQVGYEVALFHILHDIIYNLNATRPAAVCVVTGPGSFQGIRVGVACARALGLVWKIPVIGVSAYEVLAYRFWMETHRRGRLGVVVKNDKGMGSFQKFLLTEENVLPCSKAVEFLYKNLEEVEIFGKLHYIIGSMMSSHVINGEFIPRYGDVFLETVAALGQKKIDEGEGKKSARPFYIRESVF
jgi:tRNA A37 threonylcarbamoyladenosine modification protein TsaB